MYERQGSAGHGSTPLGWAQRGLANGDAMIMADIATDIIRTVDGQPDISHHLRLLQPKNHDLI
jgi:hypothetical protein